MPIVTKTITNVTASLPSPSRVTLFHSINTGKFAFKKSDGSVREVSDYPNDIHFTKYSTNNTLNNLHVGKIFLYAGTVSSDSSALVGSLKGSSIVTVKLYRESTLQNITTWISTNNFLTGVLLSSNIIIPADDWYTVNFSLNNINDVGIFRSINFKYL